MSRWSTNPPDDDRYSDREPDVQDTPPDGEPWATINSAPRWHMDIESGQMVDPTEYAKHAMSEPWPSAAVLFDQEALTRLLAPEAPLAGTPVLVIDPAEHAMHTLIDALTDLEKAIVSATTLERVQQLKQLTKRAFAQANAVDLKASAKMDTLVERLR